MGEQCRSDCPRLRLRALLGTLLVGASPAAVLQAALPPDIEPPAAAVPASSEPNDSDSLLFASPTTRDHIGRVVVPVTINGRGPFRFIVDTGANHSTISPKLALALDLKPAETPSILLDGITGSAQVSFVTIDRLQAGDLTMESTALPIVWAPLMAGADGILGMAGLTEKTLLIDFQGNRVVIARRVDSAVRSDSTKLRGLRMNTGLIALEARVGRVPVHAVIDTGAERTMGNLALRDALKARRDHGDTAKMTSVYGATTEVEPGEFVIAPPISIDSVRITDVAIVFGEFHIFDVWGMRNQPAVIIGMDVLGTFTSLSIDFKNQVVYVASPRSGDTTLSLMRGLSGGTTQKK